MTGCSFKKGLYEFHMEPPRCCIPCDHLEVPGAPEHSWEATTMASSLVTFPFLKTCHAEQAETRTRKERGIFRVVVTWLGLLTTASDVVQGSGSRLFLEQTCGSEHGWRSLPGLPFQDPTESMARVQNLMGLSLHHHILSWHPMAQPTRQHAVFPFQIAYLGVHSRKS